MLAINTKTGEANFGVVGAGQHPVFRGIDGANNMIVGTLWHTLGESTITFINHYGEQAVQRPDLVAGVLYDYQSLKKALDEVMPEKTQKYRNFLEHGDDWSGIAIKAENYLLSYLAPSTPPSAEQEAIIEDALDNSHPDEALVDNEDLQAFSRDDPEEQPTSSTTEDPGTSEPPAIINDPTTGTEDPNTIEDPARTEDPNTIEDPTSIEDPNTLKDPSIIEAPPAHEPAEIGHGE